MRNDFYDLPVNTDPQALEKGMSYDELTMCQWYATAREYADERRKAIQLFHCVCETVDLYAKAHDDYMATKYVWDVVELMEVATPRYHIDWERNNEEFFEITSLTLEYDGSDFYGIPAECVEEHIVKREVAC